MKKDREGYKMTELGEIPIDWECSKLENYVEIRSGNSPSGFRLKEKGKYPFFKVDDMNYTSKYMKIAKVYFDEYKYELMPKGMVVFPKRGASIFTNKVAILDADGYFDTNTMGLACGSKLNNEYLYYQLKFIGLEKFADTTAVPQINNKHINPLVIPIPIIEEQEKIVSILSSVDEQIDNVDELIKKNKELKKGLMQQLLTKGIGHTKFKKTEIGDIPEEWEVKKLKDLGSSIIGLTYSPDDLVGEGEGTLVLRSSNIKNSRIVFDDNKYVKANIQDKLIVKEDDILICSRNGSKDLIGKCALIDKKTEGCSFGAFMTIYRSHYNKYLFNVFTSYMFKRQIYNNLGATINQITTDNLNNFKVILPPIKEQEKIASILSKVDEKIDEYANKKQKLEELKKGLMQQLLTGRTRVI